MMLRVMMANINGNKHKVAFSWILTGLSVAGVVLNIMKLKACFFIWAFTNFSWMMINFRASKIRPELCAAGWLFFIYFILAIVGIVKW